MLGPVSMTGISWPPDEVTRLTLVRVSPVTQTKSVPVPRAGEIATANPTPSENGTKNASLASGERPLTGQKRPCLIVSRLRSGPV